MGSALTYQGQLQQSNSPGNIIGQPASGPVTAVCDFRFSLWDAVTNGNLVGATQTNSAVSVSNGLFTVTLDFGASAFNGNARWLDIGVRTNGGGAFTALTPRQLVPVVPYALYATAAGNTAATNFSGTFTNSAYYGNGGGLTNLNYNNITNPPAIPSTNGLATTNYVIAATTNLGRTIAVNMTNALNQFTGTFTNGSYYGNGGGLTNIPTSGVSNFLGAVTNVATGQGFVTASITNGFQTTNIYLSQWSNIGTNQFDTNNAGIAAAQVATNNFGATVAVNMTNALNQFTGTFTNGTYYGNGGGLTNVYAYTALQAITTTTKYTFPHGLTHLPYFYSVELYCTNHDDATGYSLGQSVKWGDVVKNNLTGQEFCDATNVYFTLTANLNDNWNLISIVPASGGTAVNTTSSTNWNLKVVAQ